MLQSSAVKGRAMLIPRQKTPDLRLPMVGGGTFDLSAETSGRGTMLVFYRGLHCPICVRYLKDLEDKVDDFAERGVGVVAISTDSAERAQTMADQVGAQKLRFAYDLGLQTARDWGLYISTSNGVTSAGVEEPALFAEPGLFLVTPQQTLYFGSVQTMPFTRPPLAEILGALDFVIAKTYPARGEYTGAVPQAAE
jgi:peroxiredoxin